MAALPTVLPVTGYSDGNFQLQGDFIRFGSNRIIGFTTGAPTGGANVFGPGSLIVDYASGEIYTNTGTLASPTWTQQSA